MSNVKKTVLILTILLLLSFSSCIDRLYGYDTDYSTGILLTPEMIESIIDAATVEEIEKYPSETDIDGKLIVYWLSGGSVWHASSMCSTIERAESDQINVGSIAEAEAEGKIRSCKICAEDIDYTPETEIVTSAEIMTEAETLKHPKDYAEDGSLIVYWTKSGTVWHESLSCSSLANTNKENLFSGSEQEAASAGKERVCKKCS